MDSNYDVLNHVNDHVKNKHIMLTYFTSKIAVIYLLINDYLSSVTCMLSLYSNGYSNLKTKDRISFDHLCKKFVTCWN
jgi:hypothetical protein